jgi:hypothetical protein
MKRTEQNKTGTVLTTLIKRTIVAVDDANDIQQY